MRNQSQTQGDIRTPKVSNQTQWVAYIRCSTSKQDYGLEVQEQTIKSFIDRSGGELAGVYVEQISGKLKDRPQLKQAIKKVKQTQNGRLLISKLDRLSRNLAQIALLMETKVPFTCCDNPTANELVIGIMASIGQWEANMISTRTKEALHLLKDKGVRLGNPRLKEHNQIIRQRALDFTKEHLDTLRQYRKEGLSYHKIVEKMNKRRIKAVNGSGWTYSLVYRILNRYGREILS